MDIGIKHNTVPVPEYTEMHVTKRERELITASRRAGTLRETRTVDHDTERTLKLYAAMNSVSNRGGK